MLPGDPKKVFDRPAASSADPQNCRGRGCVQARISFFIGSSHRVAAMRQKNYRVARKHPLSFISTRICTEKYHSGTENVSQDASEGCLRGPKMPPGNVTGTQRRSSGTPGAESLIIAESSSKIWSPAGTTLAPLSPRSPPSLITFYRSS